MEQRFGRESTRWDLAGFLMVSAVSQVLIRGACLAEPGMTPWAWSLGFFITLGATHFLNSKMAPLKGLLITTGILVLIFVGTAAPHVMEALSLSPDKGTADLQILMQQMGEYLAGSRDVLPETLKTVVANGIGCVCALMFLWVRRWSRRNVVLGAVLVYGCIRWNQYIPELDGPLMLLALAWCFSAAMEGAPGIEGLSAQSRYKGRLMVAVCMTAGVFFVSGVLSSLFPLEALNRWVGGWIPVQEVFRNEYTKHGQTGFALDDTQWYPLRNRLGGSVTLDRKPVMQVRTSRPGLYLRGMVKINYTGQTWETEPISLAAITDHGNVKGTEPFIMTIHPFNNRDLTVFTPLHVDLVTAEKRHVLEGRDGLYRLGFQWFPDQQTVYRVEGFYKAVENDPLSQRDAYLQLPEISPALKEKTVEIAGEGTDADKMARLTAWLRATGTYRLDVAEPSAERDFVEQFVMGSREGYCTYFSTALAVMGRISGVPTRYVEGYRIPSESAGRQTYTITSDRAHAWVEAYLPEAGWVQYEPTPGFGSTSVNGANHSVSLQEKQTEEPAVINHESQEGKNTAAFSPMPAVLVSGLILVLILTAIRVAWVEYCWRKGTSGPGAPLWMLYALLSVLTLLLPEIKELKTPTEKLRVAASNFTFSARSSHDIIKDTNRLLYGRQVMGSDSFRELLEEAWRDYRERRGILRYLYCRYGSLTLFNSYDSLIRHRYFRKEATHGADQPHTSPQS